MIWSLISKSHMQFLLSTLLGQQTLNIWMYKQQNDVATLPFTAEYISRFTSDNFHF
jgi:hypothetical protein